MREGRSPSCVRSQLGHRCIPQCTRSRRPEYIGGNHTRSSHRDRVFHLILFSPSSPPSSPALTQPLTQSEFYEATWEVVNSPSTSVTKWGPIEDWDTSDVTTLQYAFATHRNEAGSNSGFSSNSKIAAFNGDISKWDTSSVKSLDFTFYRAAAFNGDMSTWITSSVTTMISTFNKAASFTGTGLDLWNINKVKKLRGIFLNAKALTSYNKRKIADAWKSNAAFKATTYDTDWTAEGQSPDLWNTATPGWVIMGVVILNIATCVWCQGGYSAPICPCAGCSKTRYRRRAAANNQLGSELPAVAPVVGRATHGTIAAVTSTMMVEIPTTPTTGGDARTTKKEAAGGGAATTTVPAPVAAARELFATMDGNTATIKAALVMGAAQVQGGSLVLDKATVIAEGGAKRKWLVEQGREWPSREFGGLIIAVADADAAYQNTIL